ncbi:MAG: CPBP family intramembrane metalloprotease [candidate division Zixibacteria bacterium]|nr:CPBP family intramembrane metalloprotease [candidate division Zixibacteria bacterium]
MNKWVIYFKIYLFPFIEAVIALALWYLAYGDIFSIGFKFALNKGSLIASLISVSLIGGMWFRFFEALSDKSKYDHIKEKLKSTQIFLPTSSIQLRFFIPMVIIGGIAEEILFRGYLIGYLSNFTSLGIALLLSSAIFGFAHLYQGWKSLFKLSIGGLVLGALYIMSGSLLFSIVVHISMNSSIIALSVLVNKE